MTSPAAARTNRDLEVLAVFVHGALAFGHLLGLIHNIRRRNQWDVLMHGAALAYDLRATIRHAQQV